MNTNESQEYEEKLILEGHSSCWNIILICQSLTDMSPPIHEQTVNNPVILFHNKHH